HLAELRKAETLQQALVAAETIEDVVAQARALARLLPYLPEPRRAEVLQQALAVAQTIETGQARAAVLIDLIPYLPEPRRAEVLQQAFAAVQAIGVQAIEDIGEWAGALARLAPHLPEALLQQVLVTVQGMPKYAWERATTLVRLAPYLSEALQQQAVAI